MRVAGCSLSRMTLVRLASGTRPTARARLSSPTKPHERCLFAFCNSEIERGVDASSTVFPTEQGIPDVNQLNTNRHAHRDIHDQLHQQVSL